MGKAGKSEFEARKYYRLIRDAIKEDAPKGDITSVATVSAKTRCKAVLIAKEDATLAGLTIFEATFRLISRSATVKLLKKDGDQVKKGDRVAIVTGPARAVLTGERVALNFMQRMSGIATLTRKFVDAVNNVSATVKILDTRKTTPLLRDLEKYSVLCGGGENHRRDLSSMILIKENHIAAAGGITKSINRARKAVGKKGFIEVEVTNMAEVKEALDAGANRLLLDNMTPAEVKRAVKIVGDKAETEASGNMTVKMAPKYAKAGVDYISVGALTHSPAAADISLLIEVEDVQSVNS